jgi:hypothetical protein
MVTLYRELENWQKESGKRFLSVSIEKDGDSFCCIALTNPTEVVIVAKEDDGDTVPMGEYKEISRAKGRNQLSVKL